MPTSSPPIVSGDVQVGYVGSSPFATAASRGIDIKAFFVPSISGTDEALVVRNGAGITTPADLKGKRLSAAPVSTDHHQLLATLEQNGIAERTPPCWRCLASRRPRRRRRVGSRLAPVAGPAADRGVVFRGTRCCPGAASPTMWRSGSNSPAFRAARAVGASPISCISCSSMASPTRSRRSQGPADGRALWRARQPDPQTMQLLLLRIWAETGKQILFIAHSIEGGPAARHHRSRYVAPPRACRSAP
ncbi:MAG: ABC transporter substrate-binding protein [Janthinobacterium lividum]